MTQQSPIKSAKATPPAPRAHEKPVFSFTPTPQSDFRKLKLSPNAAEGKQRPSLKDLGTLAAAQTRVEAPERPPQPQAESDSAKAPEAPQKASSEPKSQSAPKSRRRHKHKKPQIALKPLRSR